MSTR
ncbi:hypothetical protein LINGRAHAP2_LOCUS25577 [Linum grandiflorum]|jgi:hypothetical protein